VAFGVFSQVRVRGYCTPELVLYYFEASAARYGVCASGRVLRSAQFGSMAEGRASELMFHAPRSFCADYCVLPRTTVLCTLGECTLGERTLGERTLECTLGECTLVNAHLVNAHLMNAHLVNAHSVNAHLVNAHLNGHWVNAHW
jgi:uncharacterized protein YjbI with pentapeptide repeats